MDTKRSSSPPGQPGQLKNMLKYNRCKSSDKEKNMQISIVLPDASPICCLVLIGEIDILAQL